MASLLGYAGAGLMEGLGKGMVAQAEMSGRDKREAALLAMRGEQDVKMAQRREAHDIKMSERDQSFREGLLGQENAARLELEDKRAANERALAGERAASERELIGARGEQERKTDRAKAEREAGIIDLGGGVKLVNVDGELRNPYTGEVADPESAYWRVWNDIYKINRQNYSDDEEAAKAADRRAGQQFRGLDLPGFEMPKRGARDPSATVEAGQESKPESRPESSGPRANAPTVMRPMPIKGVQGSGTQADPFVNPTPEQLRGMRGPVYILVNGQLMKKG